MPDFNPTRDSSLKSWVESANQPGCDFPIQNLPFGVISDRSNPVPRIGVAIGDQVLDLAVLEQVEILLADGSRAIFNQPILNPFIALRQNAWRETRAKITALLRDDNPVLRDNTSLCRRALLPIAGVSLHMPIDVRGYTDFYSSKEHATNVGSIFRDPKNPLLPNWAEMPVAYNGRTSSIIVSGTPVRRPQGQLMPPNSVRPVFGPCRMLDFELETAFIVGEGNVLGEPISIDGAEKHIFGMVLLNDWSARDIQRWEYVPLGPFNGKTFATSISPWVITMEALEPFRVQGPTQNPQPLPYLQQTGRHSFDIHLEVKLKPDGTGESTTITRTNFRHIYWSMAQQLAHHTVSGCNTRAGDLMASGTISGPEPESFASLLELTWNGQKPLELLNGGQRGFLEDGDNVTMTGWCQGDGFRVGFGEASGVVLPARL
ncbi:MAG: fumarylacetoacetase [Betaproteobacteria bacterium]|nr:fumarylacetoacetase [Betaproteobacteria bacterium]